ncbi:MAG TPA: bifunctional proline dehydrogenase/L-glutamate gamma-semialdehyde dehydrogenase PutA [Steroidobacteraceae bacterium]|nr:bifunctional proline dehydrogenase/L-glutamate gamma-semialdehyde dehydrogenase PutA [Steroidobacteraceae bacterium]
MTPFLRPTGDALELPIAGAINRLWLADEESVIRELLPLARLEPQARAAITAHAASLVERVRGVRVDKTGMDAFLREYDLSSQEGVILMCLAEALLRIPDAITADRLIADKIKAGDWASHLSDGGSLFVNASTWGLMLTGRIVQPDAGTRADPASFVRNLVARVGEPVVRTSLRQAMRILGHQFVMGRNIDEALERSVEGANARYRYSFDMLGESALTMPDAERYLEAYSAAIESIGRAARAQRDATPDSAPSISVKLSALHPRYEFAKRERVHAELAPRLVLLAERAAAAGIALTVDAEESERLEISLELIERVLTTPTLVGWQGFGLAVQAYQKRAPDVLRWLIARTRGAGRRLNVRLVKGAYWDSEIKRAQERGHPGYPVYTRKQSTDVAYLACASLMLDAPDVVYPQFATHNAHTVASILHLARGRGRAFEFQRLHGMGEELYGIVTDPAGEAAPCRVYAPVGSHEDLLPYLVRRLLENGANTSFVNRIVDARLPAAEIAADPVAFVESLPTAPHPRIPLPARIYGAERPNSMGLNLADGHALGELKRGAAAALAELATAAPIVAGRARAARAAVLERGRRLRSPADREEIVGAVVEAEAADVERALAAASEAFCDWDLTPADARAAILERAADAYEARRAEFIGLLVREAGKSVADGVAEVREAVDFLRYYAQRARLDFARAQPLPGPTGESNELLLRGRGVFVCISPWNFPLAIYTGQIAAALAAGNAVIAKPAEQTPLVAALATELMLDSGIPAAVLQFLPGEGAAIGALLTRDPRVAGVAFTGSNDTASAIQRALAARPGPVATLIAETGGQNAMIVDSSALPEQVVNDAITSAFGSAGQRCSALRILCVQEEIAERVETLLAGAMDELAIGPPGLLATDVGPVIDAEALGRLEQHAASIVRGARWSHRVAPPAGAARGSFFAPLAVEIPRIEVLEREVFGPVLHVLRWKARDLDALVDAINATGYGLTLGIHTRIDSTVARIRARARVGNVYVNRNMIGAVVGVQPFGGTGLSGTGPKAGGPHYLHRFATEQTVTVNTAAVGGNASLLALAG